MMTLGWVPMMLPSAAPAIVRRARDGALAGPLFPARAALDVPAALARVALALI